MSNVTRTIIQLQTYFMHRNFNKNLRYLNLSGNERLQIKQESGSLVSHQLAGFSELAQLRALGLLDLFIPTAGSIASVDIPEETEERRIRKASSVVNGMSYGIADTLGKHEHLNMLDLVHDFGGSQTNIVFAMFGRAHPPEHSPAALSSNRLAKYLQTNFVPVFDSQMEALKPRRPENIPDALRRAFLKLNQDFYDVLFRLSQESPATVDNSILRSGACGIVVFISGRKMYVANVGDTLAVISREGCAHPVSRRHEPFDRDETARIYAAEGRVSPDGLVNGEVEVSRSFGFYHLLPIINARPEIRVYDLNELDDFVIIANRGLWDYVSYQSAVEIGQGAEPMMAAQELRDLAISCGADGATMVMIISVADLFQDALPVDKRRRDGLKMAGKRKRRPPRTPPTDENLARQPLMQEARSEDPPVKRAGTHNQPKSVMTQLVSLLIVLGVPVFSSFGSSGFFL